MSGILGILDFSPRIDVAGTAEAMLRRLEPRGREKTDLMSSGAATLGVARSSWEEKSDRGGPATVTRDRDCYIVADATLYYPKDLLRRLSGAGVEAQGDSASHLILAAYRAFGDECAKHLEGDFAFILWDSEHRKMVCARDASGVRSLHFARIDGSFVVASTIRAVLEHPNCPDDFDLGNLGVDAAGLLFAYNGGTSYRAVQAVGGGETIVCDSAGLRRTYWWDPQVSASRATGSMDTAAEELREILADAVEQRFDRSGPTSIWLSGGWDSPSIFMAGQDRLTKQGRSLSPISVSFPVGDIGREDEKIAGIAARWNTPVHWVDVSSIPLMELSAEANREREEPYPFFFSRWIRYLARTSRSIDSRVAINGGGGNFLFESSSVALADLVARGKVLSLLREWRALGVRSRKAHTVFRLMIRPLLGPLTLGVAERMRGSLLLGTYERPLPRWLRPDFVARHGIAERARAATPPMRRGRASEDELEWFMTHQAFPRMNALSYQYMLSEGVEARAPLYDQRVIRFATSRPGSERFSNAGTKWLLRHMMKGRVPDEVIAPRRPGAGSLTTYVQKSFDLLFPELYELFRSPVLADLGIVEPSKLKLDLDRHASGIRSKFLAEQVIFAAHVESWLQTSQASRDESSGGVGSMGHLEAAVR